MTDKLTFLAPEPITLIDEETDENDTVPLRDDTREQNGSTLSTFDIVNRQRSNSTINSKYTFLKALIGNSTVVKGDNGNKYMVWKITIILKPRVNPLGSNKDIVASPQIEIYKRYSDFIRFRTELLNRIASLQRNEPDLTLYKNMKIPELPPKVPWYELWQYNNVNLDNEWLFRRRRGLEYFLNYILLNRYIVEACQDLIKRFMGTRVQ